MKKSELRQLIREILKEQSPEGTSTVTMATGTPQECCDILQTYTNNVIGALDAEFGTLNQTVRDAAQIMTHQLLIMKSRLGCKGYITTLGHDGRP
jgi:hypothetical protein